MIKDSLELLCKNLQCYVCKKSVDEVTFEDDPCRMIYQFSVKCHGESTLYEVSRNFFMEYLPSEMKLDYVFKPEKEAN